MNVLHTTLHFRICFLGSLTFKGGPLLDNQATLCWCPTPLLPIHQQVVYICYSATARRSTLTFPLPGDFQDPCLLLHLVSCMGGLTSHLQLYTPTVS